LIIERDVKKLTNIGDNGKPLFAEHHLVKIFLRNISAVPIYSL